jgi:SNF2 family DNA or RNA helicase
MRSRKDLHDYQNKTVEFIKRRKRCGLALFMGAGKTTTTLTAISDLSDGLMINKVLIIAPLRVANTVWKQEATNWSHLNHLNISICTGTEKQRLAALHRQADIYVINRENVVWLTNIYKKRWPFDTVIIDESSSFKSAASQRFKALKKIIHNVKYLVLLTGTPAPNGLLDLWSQQYLIDFGMTLGRTMTSYKQRFFESDYMGYKFTPRLGADEFIHKLLKPHWMSMAAEDYLQLPDRIDIVMKILLDDSIMERYIEFKEEMFAYLADGEVIETLTAAALVNKLLQWCNGTIYTDDKGNWSEIHSAKLDALADIIEDNAGESILVAYNYKSDLIRLQKRFPHAVVLDKSERTVELWNRGMIPLLLAHPQSAGHGLNLQAGGCIAVWFGLNWSLEYYLQFNARLHRQGQTRPVRIIHLVAEDCMDEIVMDTLAKKDVTQNELLAALKKDIDSIKLQS